MIAISMSHYRVMVSTLTAMKVRQWTPRNLKAHGAVIPRSIVTMDDATQYMCNASGEAFYMRLVNGDVEPVVINPALRPIFTKRIDTPVEASAVLREWYGNA